MNNKIIIKKDHVKDCFIAYTDDEMYCVKENYYGNYIGNKTKNGSHHRWVVMECNNPQCDFRAIINHNVLSDLVVRRNNQGNY